MIKIKTIKESDLFTPVSEYYKAFGYEVYSEVIPKHGMKRADIVLKKDDEIIIIEMKKTLSFDLIDQIRNWIPFSNRVYIAVPKIKTERSKTAMDILKIFGIGLIEIDLNDYHKKKIYLETHSQDVNINQYINSLQDDLKFGLKITHGLSRDMKEYEKKWFSDLKEEHKTWLTGGSSTKDGKYVTSYALLMNDIYKFLRLSLANKENDGWVTIKEIIQYLEENSSNSVKSHYVNMNSGIRQGLLKFENEDVENLRIDRKIHFKIMEESTKYKFN